MKYGGAVIGGGIGSIFGPVGTVLGASAGAWLQGLIQNPDEDDIFIAKLPVSLDVEDVVDGRILTIELEGGAPLPDQYVLTIWNESDGCWVTGHGPFADRHRVFYAAVVTNGSRNSLSIFLPLGAANVTPHKVFNTQVFAVSGDEVIGAGTFFMTWPEQEAFSWMAIFAPLIALMGLVAERVTGQAGFVVAERQIQEFDLPEKDAGHLIGMLTESSNEPIEKLVAEATLRCPWLSSQDVLECLAEIALATGKCTFAVADLIQEIAFAYGFTESEWTDLRADLLLDSPREEADVSDVEGDTLGAYEFLGLERGAAGAEARGSYRNLMMLYDANRLRELPKLHDAIGHIRKDIESAYRLVLQDIAGRPGH